MSKIRPILMDINKYAPADYNPRKADAERLELVKLSLSKLGWLLPLYCKPDGTLLSGHQRTKMAKACGFAKVPMCVVDIPDSKERYANILFNRATNDFSDSDKSSDLAQEIKKFDKDEILGGVADKKINSLGSYPCMRAKEIAISELLEKHTRVIEPYHIAAGRSLYKLGIMMPAVVTESGRIVNGAGRIVAASEKKNTTYPCTIISDNEAEAAYILLNMLSMDFSVEDSYGDLLRYNSFRSPSGVRSSLGKGFVHLLPSKFHSNFNHKTHANLWRETYGNHVVDFGAGLMQETSMLNDIGIDCTPFEPFIISRDNSEDDETKERMFDLDAVRRVATSFLDQLGSCKKYDTVFISSVLQSVPFPKDRRHVVALLSAICGTGRVIATAKSVNNGSWTKLGEGSRSTSKALNNTSTFKCDEEEGVYLSMNPNTARPKIQKFYTSEEFEELFSEHFAKVDVKSSGSYVYAVCSKPIIDAQKLKEAIEFEFDLPYPTGETMDLVEEAKEAFSRRLGIKIP